MRAPGVVDVVEPVDLGLQLRELLGERLFVEVAEQGLVEAFVRALGGRPVGRAGDRLGAPFLRAHHEPAQHPTLSRMERGTVVRERPLEHAVGAPSLVEHPRRVTDVLTQNRHRCRAT